MTPPAAHAPPSPRRRSSTLRAFAGLCLLVQLVAMAHLVLVRHDLCPVHGEVMHGGEALAVEIHAGDGESAGRSAVTVRAARPAEAGSDADDHCQALTERRDVARPVAPCAHLDVAVADLAAPTPTAPSARARALYRLAPKISPPAAA